MQLQGKTALIGGAGRNNGKSIALAFAREGADLILVSKQREDELKSVAKQCETFGVKTLPLLADLSNHDEVNRMVRLGLDRFGKVDVLVSVAGMRPHGDIWNTSYEQWHQVMAVNLHSTFYLAKAVMPGMMERKTGNIIALGGGASLAPQPHQATVVVSKHGLYGLIKSLALELGPYGIRANLIALSRIKNKRLNPEWYPETGTGGLDITGLPLGRYGTTEEVANVALFLASEQSSYVTGDRIICAGGRIM